MAQNTFLDRHVEKINGLTFRKLIDKLNADVYGRDMRKDISDSVEALGSAITELRDGGSGSGVGWTDYQIGQLEKILKAAAYADTGIGDEINKLIASLRHIKVLTSLNIQPDNVTLNAGDSLDSIKSMISVYALYDADIPREIDGYKIEGTLIQGKDCPVSISYTEGDITVTSTIIVTVRNRVPNGISARFFGDVKYLPIGTTYAEVQDSIYAQLSYNDGYKEITQDWLSDGNTVMNGKNNWTIASSLYPSIATVLEFYGTMYSIFGNARVAYLLEGCSSTNTEEEIAYGNEFQTVISADNGTIASLKVFVNGVDCTSQFAPDGKTINIPGEYVTMSGRIIISAIKAVGYTVSYDLTNCTSSNTAESVSYKGAFLTVITPNDGYELDLEKTYITMGTNKILSNSGTFSILGVTDNIKVYGVAKPASGGEVTLTSISASYTGGTVPAGTTLNQLKDHLTVTATYSDGSTAPVTGYSLSGTLTAGQTNTITVTYQDKIATFSVTVEEESTESYELVFQDTTATANDVNMTGFETLGSTYEEISAAVIQNKFASISTPITYNASKTYVFTATVLGYGLRFQYGFFDAAGNLVGYTGWDSIGNIGTTVPSTVALNGSTVTLNKNGTITTETIDTSSTATISVLVRGKRETPHGAKSETGVYADTAGVYTFEWSVSG